MAIQTLVFFLFVAIPLQAKTEYAPTAEYYAAIDGLKDEALKTKLREIIFHRTKWYRYGSGANKSWDAFYQTDRDSSDNSVIDMYSNTKRYFNPDKPTASVANCDIEHMFPKSWWGGENKATDPAYCDLHHLVPADFSANRSKSNYGPGIPDMNGDKLFNNGSFITGSDKIHHLVRVFSPADEYKGDFARAYFYIATCYGDSVTWVDAAVAAGMTNEGWKEFQPWLSDLLLEWHRMDPVSEKELVRTSKVFQLQGNRNPFIDYPDLAEYIWGSHTGECVSLAELTSAFNDSTWHTADRTTLKAARKVSDKPSVTITYMNGATKYATQIGYAGQTITAIEAPTACDDYTFVGWTTQEYAPDNTTTPTIDYTDVFPTANITYHAVFSRTESDINNIASTGTTLWAESFSGFAANDIPQESNDSTVVYRGGTVNYYCEGKGDNTKVYTGTMYAGGVSPELMIEKSTGVFSVSGIATGNATEMTLSFKTNRKATEYNYASTTKGIAFVGKLNKNGQIVSFDVCNEGNATFNLTITNQCSSNGRLDDFELIVKTPASENRTTYYTTMPECECHVTLMAMSNDEIKGIIIIE